MHRTTAILLILLLVFSFCIRLPFISVPLERDEGVRAVIAQGMLQGGLPYRDFYTNKPPGILFIYALILRVFGASVEGIHLSLYIYTLAAILMLFVLSMMMTKDRLVSFIAALAFSISSLSPRVYGSAANLEHFMTLPIILSGICVYRGLEKNHLPLLFLSGVCAGITMFIKQSGVFTLFFLIGVTVYETFVLRRTPPARCIKAVSTIIGGAALVLGAVLLYFWAHHIVGPALRWTLQVTSSYLSSRPFSAMRFWRVTWPILTENPALYLLAGIALIYVILRPSRTHGFMLSWTFFAACSLIPGTRFIKHYYILMFLPVSVLAGIGVRKMHIFLGQARIPALRLAGYAALVALAVFPLFQAYRPYLAAADPDAMARLIYPKNFFPETRMAGDYIKKNTLPNDTILVVGNEPQIYFYAQRKSATRHIGFFYLFNKYPGEAAMQRQAYEEILRNDPAYIAWFYVFPSIEVARGADLFLLQKLDELVAARYVLDGVGMFMCDDPTVRCCLFGQEARAFSAPQGGMCLFMKLFRKTEGR